jgi:hypothetical protein
MTRSRTAATRPPTPTTPARGKGGGAGRQGSNTGGRSCSRSRSNSRRNPPSPTATAAAAAAAAAAAPTTVPAATPAAVTATAPPTLPGTPEAVPTTQILPLPIIPPMHQQTTVPQATALLTPRARNITNPLPNSNVPHSHHENDPSNTPTNHQNIPSRPPTPNWNGLPRQTWTGFKPIPDFQQARENEQRHHEENEIENSNPHAGYWRLLGRPREIAMEPMSIGSNFYLDYREPQNIKFFNKGSTKLPGDPFAGKHLLSWLRRFDIRASEYQWTSTLSIVGMMLTSHFAEITYEQVKAAAKDIQT